MATTAKTTEHTINLRRHWTVDDYHKMIEVGILDEQDKVELIGGEVVEMSAKGHRHSLAIIKLDRALQDRLQPETALVSAQNSFLLSDDTEPEPDVAVLRGPVDRYYTRLATADDVLLLIEVSESSLRFDRVVKLPRYARAGVPEYWIVDLTGKGGVERYTEPTDQGGYGAYTRYSRGETVASVVLPEISVSVDWLLGPQRSSGDSGGSGDKASGG